MANFSEYQRDALARMVLAGVQKATIARALGVTPETIDRHLKTDDDLKGRIKDQEARITRVLAIHHVEMLEMLDDARAAIRDGLHSGDQRLKVETARWLHEKVTPRVDQQEVNVRVEGTVSHEVNGTLKAILGHMVEIRGSNTNRYLDRVRSGPTALPGVAVIANQAPSPTTTQPADDAEGPEPPDDDLPDDQAQGGEALGKHLGLGPN